MMRQNVITIIVKRVEIEYTVVSKEAYSTTQEQSIGIDPYSENRPLTTF